MLHLLSTLLCSTAAHATILPRNRLHLQDRHIVSNITEPQFHEIIDHIVEIWKPIAEKHGAKLSATADWENSTVNAYADQRGNEWSVHFFGGLARREEVTPDGFALVVCHELGHHFGGYAFYGDRDWAAAEGQADYFATQVCARRIWLKAFKTNRKHLATRHTEVRKGCDAIWDSPPMRALCYRTGDAGLSLAKLLAAAGGSPPPSAETPDDHEVSETMVGHPNAQCRLDTYLAGSLCPEKFDLGLIPGRHHASGQTSPDAEKEASLVSCTTSRNFDTGVRPRCWFKPLL